MDQAALADAGVAGAQGSTASPARGAGEQVTQHHEVRLSPDQDGGERGPGPRRRHREQMLGASSGPWVEKVAVAASRGSHNESRPPSPHGGPRPNLVSDPLPWGNRNQTAGPRV